MSILFIVCFNLNLSSQGAIFSCVFENSQNVLQLHRSEIPRILIKLWVSKKKIQTKYSQST